MVVMRKRGHSVWAAPGGGATLLLFVFCDDCMNAFGL